MADGNLVRQSNVGKDSVVFGPTVYDLPLLPYEKQLIATIGITEEEYRQFTAEVKHRGRLRPAEYAHIPNVQNSGAEPYLISLAISLVLTGVSYLLAPKPAMPDSSQGKGGTVGTEGFTGASRFTPSRGFESLAELADYGSPIPIIFGLYDEEKEVGGMLVTPKMVWSRMFSDGTQQRAKLLFVVGEQGAFNFDTSGGIEPPELEGIFLGNNALDHIYSDLFAYYWKRSTQEDAGSDGYRIRGNDLLFGSMGSPDSGDPDATGGNEEIFLCPTTRSSAEAAFCHAYSPANNVEFGAFAAIANGNSFRVNYQVQTIFYKEGDDRNPSKKSRRSQILERVKILGNENYTRENGVGYGSGELREEFEDGSLSQTKGVGRNYSPRMGIDRIEKKNGTRIKIPSQSPLDANPEFFRTVNGIEEGDEVFFIISPTSISEDLYSDEGVPSVGDINSAVRSLQFAADDAMQIGELFSIGGLIFKVVARTQDRFDPEQNPDKVQSIRMRCIDQSLSKERKVGIVSRELVIEPNSKESEDYIDDFVSVEEKFFPIVKTSFATVRNNRPVESTEFGIRSNVYQKLNGLCAFNSLPSPSEIQEFGEDFISVNTGVINAFIIRASVFRVFVRIAGDSDSEFKPLPQYFVIRGSKPVAQYNNLRITRPADKDPAVYEYKFVAVSGSELGTLSNTKRLNELTQDGTLKTEDAFVPQVGLLKVTYKGKEIIKDDIRENSEFIRGDQKFADNTQISDISYYRSLVEKSNESEPEHSIVYVNETQLNDIVPDYQSLTLAGLSLRASRNFTQLDQMRCWLGKGLQVRRLLSPSFYAANKQDERGPSNNFADLVFHLLTDQVSGAGALLSQSPGSAPMVDETLMVEAARFMNQQQLYFNGAIVERTNIRRFVADLAPNFLCNFIVSDGKFSLKPALPYFARSGNINDGPVPVEQIFTAGNILEDTFKIEYLRSEERRGFRAVVRFRQERKNELPEEKAIEVSKDGGFGDPNVLLLPQEQFDLTQFCTSESHATKVAKYFLALRALVTHTVSFSTTIEGLNIQAGSFIKVITDSSPYNSANNGTIGSTGNITSTRRIPDGQYNILYYTSGSSEVKEGIATVSNNVVTDPEFHDSVFSLKNSSVSQNVYVVEQLTFSEEGTVDIVASEHPCDDDGKSKIVEFFQADHFTVT